MAARADEILALMLDETWDLTETLRTIEDRRDKLRDAILSLCRKRGMDRFQHTRGTLRVDRYASYKVGRASEVLHALEGLGWVDDALQVKGRALHALAAQRPDTREHFGARFPEVRHEVLVLTPRRAR